MTSAARIAIPLEDGRAVVVSLVLGRVVVEVAGEWREEFTREEAWNLTEAIDAVSTAAEASAESPPPAGPG